MLPEFALAPLGREQACAAGTALKASLGDAARPPLVYASPFSRTQETARLAVEQLGDGRVEIVTETALREQKQAAWAMMRNDALHSFAKQIALRVRPLEERLKGAMRLSEAAIARFASNVDRRLTLKPWEEMLKHPPVRAVMFYVASRWAIGQWAGFVAAMRAELEARRALRTSEAAKAQAALAAKSARLLARRKAAATWNAPSPCPQ